DEERAGSAVARHVALLVDPSRLRRFHLLLAERLKSELGLRVSLMRGRAHLPNPASVDLLLDLERSIYRLRGPRLMDRIDPKELNLPERSSGERCDIVIDLCGNEATGRDQALRLRYDGIAGEAMLVAALANGRMPVIEVEQVDIGTVIARGIASPL